MILMISPFNSITIFLPALITMAPSFFRAGKKIVIELKGEIIRIIDAEEIAESSDEFAIEKRGIKAIWVKVKAAAKKLGDDIRGRVETAIEELKPQILDSLNKIKEVTINAGKKVIIQIKGEIV